MSLKKTELFIENFKVDLFGDEAFILNYNIADITDISAKVSSYSKEIDIPSTKENNKTFSHLYDVNSEGYFNPITKKTAEVYVDGVCVMKGYFKLNSVTLIDNKYPTYHGVLYEDSLNFIKTLGELELGNLHLPLTQSTYVPVGVPSQFLLYNYSTTDYTALYLNNGKKFNLNCNNLYMPGPTNYGSLQPIPKVNSSYWIYSGSSPYAYSNPNVNAFVASLPCSITITPYSYRTVAYPVQIGIMLVSQQGGTWVHTPLTPPGIVNDNTAGPLPASIAQPWTINLQPGEGFYFYYVDQYFRYPASSGVAVPPLSVYNTYLNGTISPLNAGPNANITLDYQYIENNINVAVDYDNTDICFPLIDYNQSYPLKATGKRYNELVENERPAVRVPYEDLRPAIFIKKIWDAIFEQNGFKYISKFLDTNDDVFKKLIMIGGMDETDVQVDILHREVSSDFDVNEINILQDQDLPVVGQQTSYSYRSFLLGGAFGNWNTITAKYDYTENIYKFFTYGGYSTSTTHGYSNGLYGNIVYGRVAGKYAVKAKVKGISKPVKYGANNSSQQNLVYRLVIETLAGGSWQNDPSLFTPPAKAKWNKVKTVIFTRAQNTADQSFELNIDEIITLKKGELCRVVMYGSAEAQFDPNNTNTTAYTSKTVIKEETFVRIARCGSWVGYVANDLSNMLPRQMKQADFIMGIAKMFNLFFEPSKQDPNTIFIEPRDVYYEDGRVINWEKKLDYKKPIDISVLPHDQSKNFVFKYSDDTSDYNTEEFKKHTGNGLNFGSYKFTSGDEYVSETQELEVPFASSYLEEIEGTRPNGFSNALASGEYIPMVITKIIDKDSQIPSYNGDPVSWKKEPRILYYAGKYNLPPAPNRNYDFKLIGGNSTGTFENPLEYYAHAGHYDRLIHPRFDLNFYTDNHYLPVTYWENGYVPLGTATGSVTNVNLSSLVIGNNIVMNKSANINWFISPLLDKYIKVFNPSTPTTNYFTGLIVANTPTTVTLKITSIVGGNYGNFFWQMQMIDVDMKQNLFKSFYEKQMLELTDQTSRMMTAYFYLNPTDIANFRFNDVIYAHKEYWRVNKIVDFDTSSDVTQTTKVELVKLLRADTNRLIDYTKGGYFGVAGGILQVNNGGVILNTSSLPNALIINNSNSGVVNSIKNLGDLKSALNDKNKIFKNPDGTVSTYFNGTTTINTGTSDIQDSIRSLNETVSELKNNIDNAPISTDKSITVVTETDRFVNVEEGITNVFFDNKDRNQLWQIQIQDNQVDGFSVLFEPLGADDIAFIQIVNPTATTNEIMVVNIDNRVVVKYNEPTNVWHVNKL